MRQRARVPILADMAVRFRPLPVALLVSTLAVSLCAVPALAGGYSAYKTPKNGKWKVEELFEYTAGGSAKISKKGTRLKLSLIVGSAGTSSCDGLSGTITFTKTLKIKRVGSYKRPAVGYLSKKTQLIEPTSVKIRVDGGAPQSAKIAVIFAENGKLATTSYLTIGDDCRLNFTLRK